MSEPDNISERLWQVCDDRVHFVVGKEALADGGHPGRINVWHEGKLPGTVG
jgi:hypothetical protein